MKKKSDLFKTLPPTLILEAHYEDEELNQLRNTLKEHGCNITNSIFHAELVITKLTQAKRIRREITEEIKKQQAGFVQSTKGLDVIREKWIRKCIEEDELVDWPFTDSTWLIVHNPSIQPIMPPEQTKSPDKPKVPVEPVSKRRKLSRSGSLSAMQSGHSSSIASFFELASSEDPSSKHPASQNSAISSDVEDEKFDYRDVYSCRRRTPLVSRNEEFVKFLFEIKLARELALDQIGVRAYSTAIAAIKSYPHKITSSSEISKLPGCGQKILSLHKEFMRTGTLAEYTHLQNSSEFQTLKLFWGVWGVGAHTARQWYFDKGWRNLDDVVEGAWDSLTRVQQIGIKYYDEFNEHKIPRAEVEEIGRIVGDASQQVGPGTVYEICGGYRRGKPESGDVDIIMSNSKPHSTKNFCVGLVKVLEERGIITHTLTISTATSGRDENQKISLRQRPPLGSGERKAYGLDALDKALVVFLLPKESPFYTGVHRRVDLIIAPWRAWGTAIVGWTGGTTFERDMRLWAKKKKGLKFDSGGITDRVTGEAVQLVPKPNASAVEAEKLVFERLGLEYIPPTLRNTG